MVIKDKSTDKRSNSQNNLPTAKENITKLTERFIKEKCCSYIQITQYKNSKKKILFNK